MELTDNLEVLYFPFSLCDNEFELKKLILLFDKIHFIYPQSHGIGFAKHFPGYHQYSLCCERPIVFTENIPRVKLKEKVFFDELKSTYSFLRDRNILCSIDPKPIIDEYDSLLTASIVTDIENKEFQKEISDALILKYKDNKYIKKNSKLYLSIDPSNLVNNTISWRLGMRGLPKSLKEYLFSTKYYWAYDHDGKPKAHKTREEEIILFIPFEDEECYFIRPSIAAPISINRALLTSIIYNLPLVTDNEYFFSALSQKSQNAINFLQKTEENKNEIEPFIKNNPILFNRLKRIESQRIINLVLSELISEKRLNELTFDEILKYKLNSEIQRKSLVSSIYEWSAEIENELDSLSQVSLEDITNKFYKSKILPHITNYKKELHKIDKKLFPNLAGNISERLGLSLSVSTLTTLLAGLSLEQVLIISAAISAPIIGKSIKEYLNLKIKRMNVKIDYNLSYLLNLKQ